MIKTNSLTPKEKEVIIHKGTEACYTASFDRVHKDGTYLCKNCGIGLFSSKDHFHSGTGWPSFEQELGKNIKKEKDLDNIRTEVLCKRCSSHLGHVFFGERFTKLNTRYCINSIALDFVPFKDVSDTEEIILAAGCFWGVEYHFGKLNGVLKTEVGYTDGFCDNPSYEQVCNTNTFHIEAVRIIYDPKIIDYKHIIQFFFEIHNFQQEDGQGPDIGHQYLSNIFYYSEVQEKVANNIIHQLQDMGYKVVTKLKPVTTFWKAEDYHQKYYNKNGQMPHFHKWEKIF